MKSLPETIEVTVSRKQKPVSGLLVMLTLGVDRKNNYSFLLGPTDASGKARITKEELISDAKKTLKLAIMDYVLLEEHFTGEIESEIMSKADIAGLFRAYKIYGPENYTDGYIDMLRNALDTSCNIEGLELLVTHA